MDTGILRRLICLSAQGQSKQECCGAYLRETGQAHQGDLPTGPTQVFTLTSTVLPLLGGASYWLGWKIGTPHPKYSPQGKEGQKHILPLGMSGNMEQGERSLKNKIAFNDLSQQLKIQMK